MSSRPQCRFARQTETRLAHERRYGYPDPERTLRERLSEINELQLRLARGGPDTCVWECLLALRQRHLDAHVAHRRSTRCA